jgi:hypothetical protein
VSLRIFLEKYLVPVDGNAMKPTAKRKQSLRALLGAGIIWFHHLFFSCCSLTSLFPNKFVSGA